MAIIEILEEIINDMVMLIAALGIILLTTVIVIRRTLPRSGKNPFTLEYMRAPDPLEHDQTKRNRIIKQRFRPDKIPEDLDAVIIGSGIGGMSVAVLLARAGKTVLVLEQHDQAGGCCHTFLDKGFEFDTGIHYVGKMKEGTETRILSDFLTDGQLLWAPIDEQYDIITLGPPDKSKWYHMTAGRKNYVDNLKKFFPDDHEAIDKFMSIVDETRGAMYGMIMPKIFPRWVVRILLKTGLIYKMFPVFFKLAKMTLNEFLDEITENAELKAILGYAYGDQAAFQTDFSLPIYCSLINHYIPGAFYPVGGPSEIPFHMIPIIQSHGGQVLVDARVTQILVDDRDRAYGVRVNRNGRDTDIAAKMVISDAGVANTFRHLLPRHVAEKTALFRMCKEIGPSTACISVFVGLEGTKKELNLPAANIWAFLSADLDNEMRKYWSLDESDAADTSPPLLFIGFPSAKDPSWESRYPEKSTCTMFALCPHHWFLHWSDKRVKHRGYEYESQKNAIGQLMWRQCEIMFPQLVGKLDYIDVGTPISNRYYLGCPNGEIYGLSHVKERVQPEVLMELRPDTVVPGLYLTGQDIFTGGFAPALYGGVLCASAILHRNLLTDLKTYSKAVRKRKAFHHVQ